MSTNALGIAVTADALHAVLLERSEEETVVQLKYSASPTEDDPGLPGDEPEPMTPGVEDEPDDVTIQFGEDNDNDLFLESEFGGTDGDDGIGDVGRSTEAWNFQVVLGELLDECEELGYEDPEIAFCVSAAEIDEVELRLPEDVDGEQTEDATGLSLPASRSTLLEMVEEQYDGVLEDERVGFVPMHQTGDGRHRVLALIARPGGPVLSTLSSMRDQTLARTPRARILDSEVPLYLSLARSALQLPEDAHEKTILVRAGTDDTLVLFMEGNTLRQAEHLPELTVEDPAETICSRVILLQDEYGMGEVQHLLLSADEDEDVLADAFKSYFASAHLRLLRTHFPFDADEASEINVAAAGAALRLLDDPDYAPAFQSINLLPDRYTASTFRIPVGWSVPVLLALLGVTTLGFVWYYISNAQKINDRRDTLQSLEQRVAQVDQQALQRRIDSLEAASAEYNEGLAVTDRLLEGSNKWSRGLASMTGRLREIGGLSISQWSPEDDGKVVVQGRSNARPRVARLAREMDGEVDQLSFTDVREATLFDFQITIPLDTTKPETGRYWRERQNERLAAADESTAVAEAAAAAGAPSPDTTTDEANTESARVAAASSRPSGEETGATETSWTVVVASTPERSVAERIAGEYRDDGDVGQHRIRVRHSSEDGRYRVSVGEFSSFPAARTVLQERRDALPEDAWIYEYAAGPKQSALAQERVRGDS